MSDFIAKFKIEETEPLNATFKAYNEAPNINVETKSYITLEDKPLINDVELVGNKTAQELGLVSQEELTQDYVKNTDYASSSTGGVIKVASSRGLTVSDGYLYALTQTLNGYATTADNTFIGKGTLENVKKDIVERAVSEDGAVLSGYVKNTDYATQTVGGVITVHPSYGIEISKAGFLFPTTYDLSLYERKGHQIFISKGTLENIKNDYVKRAITDNDIVLTDEEKLSAQSWLGIDTLIGNINTILDNINGEVV